MFIRHDVAEVLNRDDMEELRRGYETAIYNSRGNHLIDATGSPEKELCRAYNKKAEAVEDAGFHRLAVTYRSIAKSYDRDAERYVERHELETRLIDGQTDK